MIRTPDKAQQAARAVGRHYIVARHYTGERVAPEPCMMPPELTYTRSADYDALRERYGALRDGTPTPGADGGSF